MRKLIVEPFQAIQPAAPIFVVVDGLDECDDDGPESSFLLALGMLVSEIPSLRFFITSRPEKHIMSGIRSPLLKGLMDTSILHHVDPRIVDNDIRHFFKHELSALARRRGRTDGWPTSEQLDLLNQRAGGLFIYAAATVNFLDHHIRDPEDQLDAIIRSPKSTVHEGETALGVYASLDSLYMAILQGSFRKNRARDDEMVRSVLSAVVLAANPLPPSAIARLTGFHRDHVQRILELLESLLILPEDPNSPVQPLHKSFPDFITDSTRCTDTRFCISPSHHTELVLRCLRIMDKSLKKNMCSIPDYFLNSEVKDLSKRLEKNGIRGALEYACSSWHKHLVTTEGRTTDAVFALRVFLEKNLLFWLEVSSVLGVVDDAKCALGDTIKWLGKVCPCR
jgi:hypothetical protein